MTKFNNEEYEVLVCDLIGDVQYANTSYRGKISTLRQYAEVIVRKILDIDPREDMTLGNEKIKLSIRNLPNYKMVEKAANKIKKKGNKSTHTKFREEVTVDEFENAMDGIFDLLSYLLINHFEKYEFGKNAEIVSAFSILPPIIRYKVLHFLNKKYPTNIAIIDKYVLAMLKAYNSEFAKKWIEENKECLLQLHTYDATLINTITEQSSHLSALIKDMAPTNMYQLCKEKVEKVGQLILHQGVRYSDFESALPYYRQVGILQGNTEEVNEFNNIMEFLYMGRKEREMLCSNIQDATIVLSEI